MKIENIEEVNRLYKIAEKIKQSMQCVLNQEHSYRECDIYKDSKLNTGYSAHISRFPDGSGGEIDLSGCYVGAELIDAVKIILINKFDLVRNTIALYGVDVTELQLNLQEKENHETD